MQKTDEWRGSAANSQIFVQNRLEQWLQELLLASSYARHRKRNLEFAFLEFNNWEAPKERPIFSQVAIVGGAKPMISDLVPRCGNSEPLRHFELDLFGSGCMAQHEEGAIDQIYCVAEKESAPKIPDSWFLRE